MNTATVHVSVGGVLSEEDFDDAQVEAFDVASGTWQIAADSTGDLSYEGVAPRGENAIVTRTFDGPLPPDLDIQVTLNADDSLPGSSGATPL